MKNEKVDLVEVVSLMEIAYLESYTFVTERLKHPFQDNYAMTVKCNTQEGMCYKLFTIISEKYNTNNWEKIETLTDNLIDKILEYFGIVDDNVGEIPINIKNLFKYKHHTDEVKNVILRECLSIRLNMLGKYKQHLQAIKEN